MPQTSSADLPAVGEAVLTSSDPALSSPRSTMTVSAEIVPPFTFTKAFVAKPLFTVTDPAVPMFSFTRATPVVPGEADASVPMTDSSTIDLFGPTNASAVQGLNSPSACPAESTQPLPRTEPSVPLMDSSGCGAAATQINSTVHVPALQPVAIGNQTFPQLESLPKTAHNESRFKGTDTARNANTAKSKQRKSKYVQTQPLYQEYWSQCTSMDLRSVSPCFQLDMSLPMVGLMPYTLLSPPLMSPRDSAFSFWQEIPQVKESGLLKHMTPQQHRLQEAVFEVVTSEASYLRSLSVVVNHFQRSQKLTQCLCATEVHTLFSNLRQVKDVSERFLMELEEQLEVDVFLSGVGELVLKHCPSFHKVYVPYVTNQMYQEQLVQRLMQGNLQFLQVLRKLEQQPVCQRQTLKSFLVLPFQRITRLKILMETILKLCKEDSVMAFSVGKALKVVSQIVLECNENVGRMKQTEELVRLEKQVHFLTTRSIPLITQGRWLLRQGRLSEILLQESSMGQRPRICTRPVYLHLFCDLLLLSRLENDHFLVEDYAFSSNVKAENFKAKSLGLPKTAFLMCLLQNHNGSSCSFILEASSENEKQEWVSLLSSQMLPRTIPVQRTDQPSLERIEGGISSCLK